MSRTAASVTGVRPEAPLPVASDRHSESIAWVKSLRGSGLAPEEAADRLHGLLVRAARFELLRRREAWHGTGGTVDDLAAQSANNALAAVLRKLDDYQFESRFTTWAYKFAVLEAAVL